MRYEEGKLKAADEKKEQGNKSEIEKGETKYEERPFFAHASVSAFHRSRTRAAGNEKRRNGIEKKEPKKE